MKQLFYAILILLSVCCRVSAQGQTSGQICFESPTNPDNVSARIEWVIQTSVDTNTQTVKIKTILSRNFTDNTYGSNAIGWPGGHSFNQLVGSDHLRLSLLDGNGVKKLEFKLDYISASSSAPSGYKSLGVWGGDGGMIYGNASAVKSVTTSLSENFNTYGYVLTSNSPVTNSNYDPDPAYPNWIFDVWYEVTVDLNAFGAAGFGTPVITGVHASPSKTGNHSEPVEPVSCPDPLELQVIGNCTQDCSESIRLTVHHPFPPFAYAWSNGETTKDISGLCAGTYTVTVITSNADTLIGSAVVADTTCPAGKLCFSSPLIPDIVNAFSEWTYNPDQTVTIRTTLAKTFVDNTYGTNTIGWSGNHFFHHLVSSDKLQLALYDANGSKKLEFKMDYISASSSAPSGYKSLGVWGGDGGIIYGNASAVKSVTTSLSENFNTYGYVLTTNSPVTNSYYDPDPAYPNWIFDVWYEVTVDLHAFGPAGFGYPQISEIHASPSKTGNNSEIVVPGNCPYNCDSTFIALTASLKPNDGCDSLPESCNCPCDGKMRSLTVQYLGSSGVNIHVYADKKKKKLITTFTNVQHGQILTVSAASLKGGTFESNTYFVSDGGTVTKIHTSCSQFIAGLTFGDFEVLGYTDGQYNSCSLLKCNGSIALQVNGGQPPYTYEWSNGEDTQNLNNLCSGNYTVTVTDANGCSATGGFTIQDIPCASAVIGDYVWNDTNANGVQDSSETGIPAIKVTLIDAGTQAVVASTFTDSLGFYLFDGLPPGSYYLIFDHTTAPANFVPTYVNAGDDDKDSDADQVTGQTSIYTLSAGDSVLTVDAGYYALACLGDMVWNDLNQNNRQDPGEPGIADVKVTLYDALTLDLVGTQWTDSSGHYLFCLLPPGSYYLVFDHASVPAGLSPVQSHVGDDSTDSNADEITGQTSVYVLAPGEINTTADAGYTCAHIPAAIQGDLVILPGDSVIYSGPSGVQSYSWFVQGSARISGPADQQTVTVVALDSCDSFILTLQTAIGNCNGSTSLMVMVEDTEPPMIDFPPAEDAFSCDEAIIFPSPLVADNSGLSLIVHVDGDDTLVGNCPNAYTIIRTFSVYDLCGNSSSATFSVSVVDTAAPVITGIGPDKSITCEEAVEFDQATAQDGCGGQVQLTYEDDTIAGQCANAYIIIRTWTATDACGNSSSATQAITVTDDTPPVITGIGPDKSITCEEAVEFDQATAQDGCGGQVQLAYEDDTIAGQCANAYIIIRTWTATDACGNSSSATQAITVTDDTPPVITGVGADETISCPAIPQFSTPLASDNCGQATLSYTDDIEFGTCSNSFTITRTWTATDACGNSSSATQAITVTDDTPPVITGIGPDKSITCEEVVEFDQATAQDGCGGQVQLAYEDDTIAGQCANAYIIIRTWTATDACGNSSSATQAITVTDDTPPVITGIGPDKSITCEEAVEFDQATAQDGCGGQVQLTYEDDTIAGQCANAYIIIRTWTATDACGNSSSATQAITVTDDTPPVITGIGPDKSITCEEAVEFDQATAQDGCGGQVQLTYEDDTIAGQCANAYIIIRTWTATDACGNSSSATQAITVTDDTPPVITGVGADETISCPAIPQFSAPLASDNCGQATLSYTDDIEFGTCSNSFTITRTWTATDACGNSSSATQAITVTDDTPPVITGIGPDKSITCEEAVEFDQATAQDGCGGQVQLTYEDDTIAGQCANAYIIIRTWTATDACGNSSSATQAITVTDDTPPVITGIGPDKSITCEEAVEFDQATAQDGCGGQVQLAYEDDTIAGQCANAYIIIRTWTATDACGNSSSATQAITVTDDTPPVITGIGPDKSITCEEVVEFDQATAQDGCGGQVQLAYEDDTIAGQCANAYIIIRTWTATDACGNSSSATQAITVTDDTPPVITGVGADETISCPAIPQFSAPLASDNCGQATLSYTDDIEFGTCSNSFTITRTWTATDACGNSSSATQAITVTDDTPPVITGIGPDKSITCEEAVEFDQATAQDGCGGQVQLAYEDDTIAGQCANAYIIIRTWTATDACGNSSSATQAITVTDDTPPVITGVGADETISCPAIPQFSTPFAEDACSQAIITFIDDITFGNCLGEYSVTRVWIATDACGNTSTASQTITVVDADAPQLVYMPADDTLQCPDVTFDAPLYMDCTQITVSFEDDTIFEQAPEHVVFIRSFLATDACGNTSDTVKQRIVLINNRIPATGIHPSCTGTCDGSVAVGGDCYSYQWSTGDTTPVVNGLCDGIYIVTMTDAFGYAVTDTVVLVAPDPIILAAEVQQVSCYGASDGAATVIAGGGTPPYTFLWSFGATTQHVSGLLFGSYIVTVSDSHGCSDTLVVEIPQPDPLELGAIAVPASCYNGSDGMITLTVAGGSSPYSFLWSTGDTTQNVEGLSAGVYSVTVTDARQCEAVVSAEVLQPDPIILSALLQDAGCPGEDAGAIDLTVSGGTGPYSYGWSNGATTEDLSGLSAGVYSVTVTDIYGCTTEGTYELLGYPGFDLEFDTIHTSCPSGQQLCKLDFAGFPHGYILNGEEYASDGIHITWVAYPNTWTNTPNINQLIIFDTYKTGTPDPDLEVGIGNIAIFPENLTDANGDGLVDVPNDTRWGGQQIYTFDFPRTVISVVIVDHDRPGGSIKAYDAFNNLIVSVPLPIIPNGGVATIPINASGVSKLVIDDDDSGGTSDIIFACDSVCCDGSASVLVSGGTPPFSYLWSNGDTTATADSLCAGIYTVTVTDANGCTRVDSIEIVAGQQQSAFRMMQDEFENFTAYPVPFDDVLFMHYLAREEGETQIRIFDMLGQVVYQRKMYAQEGVNRVALHFGETLADGVYILELRKKDYAEYKKLNKNY